MSKNVKWDITYKCNLNCAHCVNGDFLNQINNELTCEEVKLVIKKLKEAGIDYVHLLGGEPTARVDILDIFLEFQNQDLEFGFNTNGLKLIKPEFRNEVVKNNVLKNIIFSLEGPNEEINDKIRGKKVFSITSRNIREIILLKKEYKRNDLKVTVNLVVSKMNLDYIIDMIYYCIDLEVNELVLLQFIPEGNGKINDQSITVNETIEVIDKIAQEYIKIKDKINIIPRFVWPLAQKYSNIVLKKEFPKSTNMCGAGNNFFYVNNKGELFPCDRYKQRILNFNSETSIGLDKNEFWDIASQDGFGEIYEKTESNELYSFCRPCNECEYLRKECYPCLARIEKKEIMYNELCLKLMEDIKNVQI